MNILICDDITTEANDLAELIRGYDYEINTAVFSNANDVLDYVRSGAFIDVCFLDIVMPGVNGVALAKLLREDGYKGRIIFLSASRDYGPEAVSVRAFSYLLKPPTKESVGGVLHELAEVQKRDDTDGILVKTTGKLCFTLFRDISHVEVIKHKIYFQLTDGSSIETNTRASFSDIAPQLLRDRRFIQCHRSYIINANAVSTLQGSDFIMRSGAAVPISRSYSEAKGQFVRFVLGGDGK